MQDEPKNKDGGEQRTDWAEDRTDWAEDRTIQANERTFAGWMRTGMGAIGVALALKAIFGDFDPTWVAKSASTVFLAVALVMFWSARRNACKTQERLDDHATDPQSTRLFTIVSTAMALGALMTGFILWML